MTTMMNACPYCGGSGDKDDVKLPTPAGYISKSQADGLMNGYQGVWTVSHEQNAVYSEGIYLAAPTPPAPVKPFDPATAPGMTDMMVPEHTLDAFMEENPLPVEPLMKQMAEALRQIAEGCSTRETLDDMQRARYSAWAIRIAVAALANYEAEKLTAAGHG